MDKHYYSNRVVLPSSRTIEFTVLSGEDLRISRKLISKNAFVTVRYATDIYECATTETDTDGGSYPSWSQKFVLQLPVGAPALTLEVNCKTPFGTKLVGRASVPVSDFCGGYVPESYLHFLSYRLRDSRGERNGIINVSVRTKVTADEDKCSGSTPVADNKRFREDSFGGLVTGVPIWTTY